MDYQFTTLSNGLRVLTVPMPNRDSAAVAVWVKTGGRFESRRLSGISHFLEHMLFKGTAQRTTRQIKEEIEGVGGILNAFTGEEVTCYFAKLLKEHYSRALEVLSDMVLNASIPSDELVKEKTVILEEIKMYRDLPSHYVHDLMGELLWPDQPLGRPLSGTPDTVSRMTRKDLLSFKSQHHHPKNILVSVSGDIKHQETLEKIMAIYGAKSSKKPSAFVKAQSYQQKPRVNFLEKKTEQTHLVLGLHGLPRNHPDRYKMGLLHILLGANMSSRLFEEVREKRGLAYEIKSGIVAYQDAGAFTISAGVETKKAVKAVQLILKELGKIRKKFVSSDELRRAKDYFMSQVYLGVEDTLDHLLWAGEKLLCGDELPNKEEIRKKVESVTVEELRELARKIFYTKNLNLALIGPVDKKTQNELKTNLVIEGN